MLLLPCILPFYLFVLLCSRFCRSYLVLPPAVRPRTSLPIPADSNDVGEPLLLTPLIRSRQIGKARALSRVDPLVEGVESNAGYLTVDERHDSNLFFWFFRATGGNWRKAPVVLWLQGGPGCSSVFGLFEENGPLRISGNVAGRRKYAWTNDYNVVYVDQPVESGFSFTNSSSGRIRNQDQVADHLYEALTQFFQLFAELKDNEFYIAGESYAGKYVPTIAYRIREQKTAGKCEMNVKGLFIISAFSDPINMQRYAQYCSTIGLMDSVAREEARVMESEIESSIRSGFWKQANDTWKRLMIFIRSQAHLPNYYDYTSQKSLGDEYVRYVQSAKIRRTIHVGNVTYSACSHDVRDDFSVDFMQSVSPRIEELLEHYPIAFVGGQFDVIVAYPLVTNFLQRLRWSGAADYRAANRSKLYDGQRLVGYCKSAGNLKDVFVRRAGHMVPGDQPRVTLSILKKFVAGNL